jgi:hypothetical protein
MTAFDLYCELRQHDMRALYHGKPCQVLTMQYETPNELGISQEMHDALPEGRTTTLRVRYFNEFLQEDDEALLFLDEFVNCSRTSMPGHLCR